MIAVPAASAVAAGGVSCGTVVTTNITLSNDVVGCAGDGLIVGASHITIDLGGHTVGASAVSGGAGVRVGPGRAGVTVRNGTIVGFVQGVVLDTAGDNHVSDLVITDSVRGIDLANASGNTVERNTISGSALDGIRVDGAASRHNLVSRNVVSDGAFIGITVSNHSRDDLIDRNHVSDGVFGIAVFGGVERVALSRNLVTGATQVGIQIDAASDDASIDHNRVWGNGIGVFVKDGVTGAGVVRNFVWGNDGDGVRIGSDDGVIDRNHIDRNGGWGIAMTATSSGNVVTRNQLRDNDLGSTSDAGSNSLRRQRAH